MKRRIVFLFLSMVVCATLFVVGVSAETEGYYTYTVSNGEATITDVDTAISGAVSIPSTLGGYPVTKIGGFAFWDCSSLTSVTIPSSVTSIGYDAFAWCDSLTSVTIPSSVTSIGDDAFVCGNLRRITVNQDNEHYMSDSYGVLFNKTQTELIKYPSGNTRISYAIPEGVTEIGDKAFSGCSSLTSVTIPEGVTDIGYSAFSGCSSLTSITIPEGVTEIGNSAFSGCSSLTSVTIPSSVTRIGAGAFSGCSSLTSVSTSASFWEQAFSHCTGLATVILRNGVLSIGQDAFSGCDSLTSIHLPESVEWVGYENSGHAFEDCANLTTITVDSNNAYFSSEDGVLFDKEKTRLIQYPRGSTRTEYIVPCSVTRIDSQAFYACKNLTSLVIPFSVTEMPYAEFYGSPNLVIIGYVGTAAETYATENGYTFYAIDEPAIVTQPVSATYSLGDIAVPLTVEITPTPGTVSYTWYKTDENGVYTTFSTEATPTPDTGVAGTSSYIVRVSVTYDGETYTVDSNPVAIEVTGNPSCGDNLTWTLDEAGTLTISGTGEMYNYDYVYNNGTAPWHNDKASIKEVVIQDGVTSIGSYAFYGCSSLTSITIPDGVTEIGDYAFQYCSSLTRITIPDGVTLISDKAFYGCNNLTSITIPDGVTSIGSYAFKNCSSLTSITIPDGVTSIGYDAFTNCSNLTIYGYAGSAAETHATENNIPFVDIQALAAAKAAAITALKAIPSAENLTDAAVAAALAEGEAAINAAQTVDEVNALYETHSAKVLAADAAASEATPTQSVTVNSIMPGKKIEITLQNLPNVQQITFHSLQDNGVLFKDLAATVDISTLTVTDASGQKIGTCEIGATTNGTQVFSLTSSDAYVDSLGNWYPILVAWDNYGVSIQTAESRFNQVITVGELTVTDPDAEAAAALAKTKAEKIAALKALPKAENLSASEVIIALSEAKAAINAAMTVAEVNALYEVHSAKVLAADAVASEATPTQSVTVNTEGRTTEITVYNISDVQKIRFHAADDTGLFKVLVAELDVSALTVKNESNQEIGTVKIKSSSDSTQVFTLTSSDTYVDDVGYWLPILLCGESYGVTVLTTNDTFTQAILAGELTTDPDAEAAAALAKAKAEKIAALKALPKTENLTDAAVAAALAEGEAAINAALTVDEVNALYETHSAKVLAADAAASEAATVIASGTCGADGDNLTWTLTKDGTLTISGTGAMADSSGGYKAPPWDSFDKSIVKVVIETGVTYIGKSAFNGCSSLTNVTIPNSVVSIGEYAFYICTGLLEVSIPASVDSIGNYAFQGCTNLTTVSMPAGVSTIGRSAFNNCSALMAITIPESSSSIEPYTFHGCTSLIDITIPENITTIGEGAFEGCSNLASVSLSNGIASIERQVFWNCAALTKIVIPTSITSIGDSAFYGCTNLTIYGFADSYAETYATANSIPFEAFNTIASAEWTSGFGSLNINLANINATESIQLTLKSTSGDPLTIMSMNASDFTITDNNAYVWSYVNENWYFMTANGSYPISQYFSVTGRARPTVGVLSHCGSIIDGTCIFSAETGWTISSDVLSGFFPFSSADMSCQLYSIPGGIGILFPQGGWARTAWTPSKDVVPASLELTADGEVTQTFALTVNAEEWKQSFTVITPTVNVPTTTESNITLTAPEGGWKNGTNTFSVTADLACAVVVSYDGGQTYTRLTATANTDGSYRFTAANVTAETIVAAIPMGDANGDGKITNADITRMKAANLGKLSFDSLYTILTDVNGDGKITNADITRMKAVNLGKTALGWN